MKKRMFLYVLKQHNTKCYMWKFNQQYQPNTHTHTRVCLPWRGWIILRLWKPLKVAFSAEIAETTSDIVVLSYFNYVCLIYSLQTTESRYILGINLCRVWTNQTHTNYSYL